MAKTIEERAKKSVPDILRINGNYVESYILGYCNGAREQKKIDVEKACGILWDMCLTRRDEFKTYKDVITTFRKAMEE